MESEIWPNIYNQLHRFGARIVIVNGRVTNSSFRNYRLAKFFFRRVLAHVDLFLMQTQLDGERIMGLGVSPSRVHIPGNLKYDLTIECNSSTTLVLDRIREALNGAPNTPILVAGSTMPGEEDSVLKLYSYLRDRHAGLRLILAPRHPERFDQVAGLVQERGYHLTRRSTLDSPLSNRSGMEPAEVLLLDTIGELPHVYQLATLVFVGGSLVDQGGHNILEPAYFGCPILFGPHMENFREIAERFLSGLGALQATDLEGLKKLADRLLSQPEERRRLGQSALEIVKRNSGALELTLQHLSTVLMSNSPKTYPVDDIYDPRP